MRYAQLTVTISMWVAVDKSVGEVEEKIYDKFPDIETLEAIGGVIVKEASVVIKMDEGLQVISA